jgi:hypothetical protein
MSDLDAHTREKHRSTDEINTKTIYKNEWKEKQLKENSSSSKKKIESWFSSD